MELLGVHDLSWRMRRNLATAWPEKAYRVDFFPARYMLRRILVGNCPEAVKHVLVDRFDNYVKSSLVRELLKPLGGGMLGSEGETWRRQRRTVAPTFQPKRLESFAPQIVAATNDLLAKWEREPEGAVIDLAVALGALTLQIVTRTLFSINIRGHAGELRTAFLNFDNFSSRPTLADMLGLSRWIKRKQPQEMADAGALLDRIVYGIIARRRRTGGPTDDMLAYLLAAREGESDDATDDVELRDQIATFFSAGHETTANVLGWTFHLLAQHPEVEAKLHAELAALLGGRPPAYGDIGTLRYTRMVIEESMRILPGANVIPREALEDDEIMGHKVAKGTTVMISPWLLHRHEKLWERPREFDPERFTPERAKERRRFAYIPFSAGPRACIGAGFAIQEAVLVLATVAQRFRLRRAPGPDPIPVGVVLIRPRDGLPMRLERR